MANLKLFAGRSNRNLAKKIAKRVGVSLGKCEIRNFGDGEIWVKYNENIRGCDVFIIQSTNPPSDNLMELLILVDAAKRASARRVTAVIPYFGYARQDRKDQPRVSITAKLVANLLREAGTDRVITMDLHAPQIQGFFDIPVDHLYSSALFVPYFIKKKIPNLTVVSPDVGGIKLARAYAKRLGVDLVLLDKRRPSFNEAEIMNIIGNVEGSNVLIIDDLIDTGGTFCNAVEALKEAGAKEVYGACTHLLLSGNAAKKIQSSEVSKIFVTDTIATDPKLLMRTKFKVLSVSAIFAEAIKRAYKNQSISSLFDIVKE